MSTIITAGGLDIEVKVVTGVVRLTLGSGDDVDAYAFLSTDQAEQLKRAIDKAVEETKQRVHIVETEGADVLVKRVDGKAFIGNGNSGMTFTASQASDLIGALKAVLA